MYSLCEHLFVQSWLCWVFLRFVNEKWKQCLCNLGGVEFFYVLLMKSENNIAEKKNENWTKQNSPKVFVSFNSLPLCLCMQWLETLGAAFVLPTMFHECRPPLLFFLTLIFHDTLNDYLKCITSSMLLKILPSSSVLNQLLHGCVWPYVDCGVADQNKVYCDVKPPFFFFFPYWLCHIWWFDCHSYSPGAWIEEVGGLELCDYDVPKTTCLILVGPRGSGKSSLINRISKVLEDDKFAPARAQVSCIIFCILTLMSIWRMNMLFHFMIYLCSSFDAR